MSELSHVCLQCYFMRGISIKSRRRKWPHYTPRHLLLHTLASSAKHLRPLIHCHHLMAFVLHCCCHVTSMLIPIWQPAVAQLTCKLWDILSTRLYIPSAPPIGSSRFDLHRVAHSKCGIHLRCETRNQSYSTLGSSTVACFIIEKSLEERTTIFSGITGNASVTWCSHSYQWLATPVLWPHLHEHFVVFHQHYQLFRLDDWLL